MLVIVMMLAGATAGDDFHPWVTFARAPVLVHASESVEIDTQGVEPGTRDLHLRARLTRRRLGRVTETLWADSATCPAVRQTVRAMSDLAVPRVTSPYDARDVTIVLDGTGYSFDGPASGPNARVAFSTNIGSPLAAWVDARLAALAQCWRPDKS